MAATTFRAHTFNMAMGNAAFQDEEDTQAVVLYIANAENPWIVALQEICEDQFEWLKEEFADQGLNMGVEVFQQHSGSTDGCDDEAEGTAVFGRGAEVGAEIRKKMLPDVGLDRWAVCQKAQNGNLLLTVCSTHLQSDRDDAAEQADYAFHWWDDVATTPWLYGGDLNQNYPANQAASNGHVPTAEWFFTHDEIHLPAEPITYNTNNEKIDFMYADRVAFNDGPFHSCTFTPFSDHRYCSGAFIR